MAGVAFCEKIDGGLARNIGFEVANLEVPKKNPSENVDFETTKCENWRKSRTKCSFFLRPRVWSRVSGFPVVSPCLWGKPQKISFRHVSNCENWRKSRAKCWF